MADEGDTPGDLQHPAYVLEEARPGEVILAPESTRRGATIGSEGWFDVPDDLEADPIRARLSDRYGVDFDADGAVSVRNPRVEDAEGDESGESDDAAEDDDTDGSGEDAEGDENVESDDVAGDDDTDGSGEDAEAGGDTDGEYSRDDLEAMDIDELREVFDDVGGDSDDVDMRKPNEIIAGILRAQAEGEEA